MVFTVEVHKDGNKFVFSIPEDEAERLNLSDGQRMVVIMQSVEGASGHSEELQTLVEESWKKNETGLRYLAGR